MISRDESLALLDKYLTDEKLLKHSYAVEAIMRAMAITLKEDEELWGLTGLLHDLDFDYTRSEPDKHANMTADILQELVPESMIDAIKGHNYRHTSHVPTTSLDKALIAADALSGLIIASALVMPSKKLKEVKVKTLRDKFKDTSFARGCDRKKIGLCVDVGLEVRPFLSLGLKALKKIHTPLGL